MTTSASGKPATSGATPGHEDGLAVHTLRDGHGLPLVLLHAFPVDHRMWRPVAEVMPGRFGVLAVDLFGFGASPDGPRTPSLEASADAVARAVRAAGSDRAVVAGLSMGGYVALALAERHPGLVAGLGLVDTKSHADPSEARLNRERIAHQVENERSTDAVMGMVASLLGRTSAERRHELTPRLESWIRAQRPSAVAWAQRAMARRPDRTGVLEGFPGPVTVVVGEEDVLSPVAEAEHMVVAHRSADLRIVPGAGHLSAVEAPDDVAAALADLVARASAR
ncbi:alpha/beta fold hydrolase [Cellulomonas sp. PhB143]|uniref:alpha/beta fold hydrolase n=1 Tax=Cellulomonas sp. PhB143 TaxID=2485186 RepID=UPI000F46258F|nr:alpha/beta hydrolase [Cellulomonas sp. PhB143]ROS78450.1 pimeloyl-ACP methyl ester carboxylesterase [Cellulomonas sp. PhB143]